MLDTLNFLAICGSLRRASYNRSALRAAELLAPADIRFEMFEIDKIPPYNEDIYVVGFPAIVQRMRSKIATADAVLIVTPEYNYSIPGVLKNALDWASRPPEQPFNGKPMAVMGASQGLSGGGRAQHHLRQVMIYLNAHFISKPEVMITDAATRFGPTGELVDEATRALIYDLVTQLAAWTRRLKTASG